jgi:hypothetical protein
MLTRKHFQAIAEILHLNEADPLLVRDIANLCASENEHFNRSKFYDVALKDD